MNAKFTCLDIVKLSKAFLYIKLDSSIISSLVPSASLKEFKKLFIVFIYTNKVLNIKIHRTKKKL